VKDCAVIHILPDPLRTILAFAIVLGVLVFVHELGHYLAARLCGVFVEAFSIGFGRALVTWTDRRGTRWKVAWLPLGGYVKLHAQERPEDVPQEVRATWRAGETFHGKPVWRRAVVVAAGPAANFLLAVVLFAALFTTVGRPAFDPVATPIVGDVMSGSAAAVAGLQPGDRILSIDGVTILSFEDIQHAVAARPDQRIALTVERAGHTLAMEATPTARATGGGHMIGVLGIKGGVAELVRLPLGTAIVEGVAQTWVVTSQTFEGIWGMLTGARGTDELGGPLRIAQLSGQVAQLGIGSLISFIAVLSVNLGLLNLFPIPILDGGHLLFFLAEAVRGRPLPPRAQEYGFRAGLALLVGLFVFATWNDLAHIGIFRWVASLIG
jgi:regulator of sigma E protease